MIGAVEAITECSKSAWNAAIEAACRDVIDLGCTCDPMDEDEGRHYAACPVQIEKKLQRLKL